MGTPEDYEMTDAEIGRAVPPPYARFIGEHIIKSLKKGDSVP